MLCITDLPQEEEAPEARPDPIGAEQPVNAGKPRSELVTPEVSMEPGRTEKPAGTSKTVSHDQLQEGEEDPQVPTISTTQRIHAIPKRVWEGEEETDAGYNTS
jgi:hypothetical protein